MNPRDVFKVLHRGCGVAFATAAYAAVLLLVGPWMCVAVVRWVARSVGRLLRSAMALRHAFAREGRCPRGHRSSLQGVFECRTCGSLFAGYVFGPCPTCGESCGYVPCEHCGLAVRNPFL